MTAKRKPFPCRLGIHNYRRTYHWAECVCGKVRETEYEIEFDNVDDLIAWLDKEERS